MNYKLYAITVVLTLGTILGIGINSIYQTAQATGGGEVIELVIPIIDDATKAVQEGDKDKALALLEEIKTELQDTFFAEEEN